MYSIKNIREEFKAKGVFYTQPELAQYLKSLIDIEIFDVYDPTCGDGNLLSCFDDDLPKYGQEINGSQLEVAKSRLVNFIGVCNDTLKNPAFMEKRFSCIVANPPFSIKWQPPIGMFKDERFAAAPALPPQSKADYAFLLHIIHLLKDNGIAIVLNFPGILYRGNNEGILRRWFIENNWIEKVIQIPPKSFIDTAIATVVLVLKKNRINTDIEFIDNELKISKVVTLEEIAANDYNLSVNSYVQKEAEKEDVDIQDLNKSARDATIQSLRARLEFDRMICQFDSFDFDEYLGQLQSVIDSFKS